MTTPSPELAAYMTRVRKQLVVLARDHNINLPALNEALVSLDLAPYSTADAVGSAVCNIQTDLSDPTARPSLAQLRSLIRVQVTNSPLNPVQVSEWQGFDILSYDAGTGVLRVRVYLRANRAGTNAELISTAQAAVSVVPYSSLVTLPRFMGQTLTNFAFAAADPDDPA
jgi:hypothetical protein